MSFNPHQWYLMGLRQAIAHLTLSTTSTSATWSPQQITNAGAILTWDVTGDITPTSQNVNDPTFDLSANTGTVNIDVYNASGLTHFYCYSNQLTSLNVSKSIDLIVLICDSNQLTSLDISANTALTEINCHTNQLTSLNVSTNINLNEIYCNSNQLTSLDISANTALEVLTCQYNQLTSLDISANTALIQLYCFANLFTPTSTDNIFITLDTNGQLNGQLFIKNNRTSASDTARANLITKGWTINDTFTT